MPARNLYVVLGVSPGESPAAIRAAYLTLARRHHPDVSGPEETGSFQEIAEAYRVLSDPALRRRHDEGLAPGEARRPPRAPVRPEPLRPEPLRVMGDPDAIHPSFAALHDRVLRNFTRLGVPKAERVEPLAFDLLLSPAEAAQGGVLPVVLPVFVRCGACGGTGQDWAFTCLRCGGEGTIEAERTVPVALPPLLPDGAVVEVPLAGLGIHNFYLRLHVRIRA